MKNSMTALLVFASFFVFEGCMVGPHITPPIDVPSNSGLLKGKRVVVSGFLKSDQDVSVTSSVQLTRILESARVQDVSLIVADHLKRKGISADARSEFSVSQLEGDQVLVRGTMIIAPLHIYGMVEIGSTLLFIGSLTIIGGIFPTPLPMHSGRDFYYRLEAIDPQGRILLQTGDLHSKIVYASYHWYGGMMSSSSVREEASEVAESTLLDRIAERLK